MLYYVLAKSPLVGSTEAEPVPAVEVPPTMTALGIRRAVNLEHPSLGESGSAPPPPSAAPTEPRANRHQLPVLPKGNPRVRPDVPAPKGSTHFPPVRKRVSRFHLADGTVETRHYGQSNPKENK
jgi:hypothetical protein